MRIYRVVLAAGLILAGSSNPNLARDTSWTLRVHGALVDSTGANSSAQDGVGTNVTVGSGFGVAAEYRLSTRVGLDLSTLFAGLEVDARVSAGTAQARVGMNMVPLTFAVPFHPLKSQRVDLFLAPSFSVVRYYGIEARAGVGWTGTRIGADTDTAFGVALGLDVPFGEGRWALSTGLRYMRTEVRDADVDPLIVTLGFAFKF